MSRTNINLDDVLVDKAMNLTHMKTKKELVHYALSVLVEREQRKKILDLEGKVEWEGDLDEMRKNRT